MKTHSTPTSKSKKSILTLMAVIFLAGSFYSNSAKCQIDYYFAQNTKGFRLGFGIGENWLQNNYRVNTPKPNFSGSLEYNANNYFSVGIKAQYGSLYGANEASSAAQPFASITNTYTSASFNMRFALGLLTNYESRSGFGDAIKAMYIGSGLGYINSSVNIPANAAISSSYSVKSSSNGLFVPINFGTSIDMHKLTGSDRFEFNPDYQFNIVDNQYFQGFTSSYSKTKLMYYSQINLAIKYKF